MNSLIQTFVAVLVILVVDVILAFLLRILWNALVPQILHGPAISFWTMFLVVLVISLFMGFSTGLYRR